MYKAIKEKFEVINQTKLSKIVGLELSTLNRIINGKQTTKKKTAYCIAKAICENAEIENYFIRTGE